MYRTIEHLEAILGNFDIFIIVIVVAMVLGGLAVRLIRRLLGQRRYRAPLALP